MNRIKTFSILACLVVFAAALPPNARADEWNKKTMLTVNEPLAIPGKVLQPGKYVIKLMDSQANRHIVQIFNEDESELQTTILAIPNQRLQPTGQTQFGFWEMPAGHPKALRSWFYPGDNVGQEFAYPKDVAAQIAKTTHESVPAIMSGEDDLASAKVEPMSPEGESHETAAAPPAPAETDTAAAQPSAPPPSTETATAQTTPPPSADTTTTAQNTAPETPSTDATSQTGSTGAALPSTASPFPLLGLVGLFSIGSALAIRAVSRRRK